MWQLLTKREAAEYLRISERTLDRYRGLKLINSVKVRNVVRFAQSDLEDFLKRHRS